MDRRGFVKLCTSVVGLHTVDPKLMAQESGVLKHYQRAKLVNAVGEPIKGAHLPLRAAHLFHYPFVGTPCFLIKCDGPIGENVSLATSAGQQYAWEGGVGPGRSIVAFSAICPHQLSYPSKRRSVINYRRDMSPVAGRSNVIVCCAHHSVFDPARGGKVIDGPAPQPLATIVLEHDGTHDELYAVGTYGGEVFDEFFRAYKIDLIEEFGRGVARQEVTGTATVLTVDAYTAGRVMC